MKLGDIVQLGRHRLMCGDATLREDVYALVGEDRVNMVLTDPPYGIKIQHKDGSVGGESPFYKGKYRLSARQHIKFNDNSTDAAREHYAIAKDIAPKQIIWGGTYFTDFLPVSGGWIFWDKNRHGLNFSDGELAWRSWGNKITRYKHTWNGVCMAGNFALNARYLKGRQSRVHPTQKPVELHMNILEDFSQPEDVILDCFGGSGTTLIACEMTGRTCLMMELSPEYCEIICERYEKLKAEYPLLASACES